MNKIINGDCLEIMKSIPDNSIDTIITDPPYGINFMNKKWDYNIPSVEIFQEMIRILKFGGYLLCFCGTRTQHRMTVNIEDAGFGIRDIISWIYGQGFPKSLDIGKKIEDDKWNGWKTALKPSCELITVAMKPLDGTYVNNALKWGVAGMNIDGARIETDELKNKIYRNKGDNLSWGGSIGKGDIKGNEKGRYPSNLILDSSAAEIMDKQSGVLKSGDNKPHMQKGENKIKLNTSKINTGVFKDDQGGASRYFKQVDFTEFERFKYCAKASQKERNLGCENNNHPTIKPVKLMEYLCKLTTTPTGGVVLDPFAGSGSTGIGAILSGRNYILIEKNKEYCDIIKQRIDEWEKNNNNLFNNLEK